MIKSTRKLFDSFISLDKRQTSWLRRRLKPVSARGSKEKTWHAKLRKISLCTPSQRSKRFHQRIIISFSCSKVKQTLLKSDSDIMKTVVKVSELLNKVLIHTAVKYWLTVLPISSSRASPLWVSMRDQCYTYTQPSPRNELDQRKVV